MLSVMRDQTTRRLNATITPLTLALAALLTASCGKESAPKEADPAPQTPESTPSTPSATEPSTTPAETPAEPAQSTATTPGLEWFVPSRRDEQASLEAALISSVSPNRLRETHDWLAGRPHIAGSPGDLSVIAQLEQTFADMGLEVETQWLTLYLPSPVDASVQVLSSDGVINLPLQEYAKPNDTLVADPELTFGWNAYSGSGDVAANVVYANYALREDFDNLAKWGIEVQDKVVIARYGKAFRGNKATNAQLAGAKALILYTDPADAGLDRSPSWPEGAAPGPDHIQRGSILNLPYPGDPLTPGIAATEDLPDADRLSPSQVDLPTIPVQPMGWEAAREILSRMQGTPISDFPDAKAWQGGLDHPYHLTGGDDLAVRVRVEQLRQFTRTANVVATLKGAVHPEELIIVGCHHDAWGYGASDPTAGTIALVEAARVLSEAAAEGRRPDRSILFAAWGAEEFGIIGSTEWVEANLDRLTPDADGGGAVAYINLDMASMGPVFSASASPSLADAAIDLARAIPQAGDNDAPAYDRWLASAGRDADTPRVGILGGGSDHEPFLCFAGVPSVSLGGSGSLGSAYHANTDHLPWYRKAVGEDYEPAAMVSRATAVFASRLANANLLPMRPERTFEIMSGELRRLTRAFPGRLPVARVEALATRADRLASRIADLEAPDHNAIQRTGPSDAGDGDSLRARNSRRRLTDRAFVFDNTGMDVIPAVTDRPFYRHFFVAPDATTGYGSWLLPDLRGALELTQDTGDTGRIRDALQTYEQILDRAETVLETY